MAEGDRADRLSQRRKDRSSDQQPEEEKPAEPAEPAEPEQQEESQSIKDQYQGTYMYLPEGLRQEFDLVADEMDTARRRRTGKHVEKIRHYEPLMISLALEKAEELDEDELEERLAEYDA